MRNRSFRLIRGEFSSDREGFAASPTTWQTMLHEMLVAEDPYRERLRAQLILALDRSGRQAEALHAYQHARRTLADELGLTPVSELKELEQAILRQDPTLARAAHQATERAAALALAPASRFTSFAAGGAQGRHRAVPRPSQAQGRRVGRLRRVADPVDVAALAIAGTGNRSWKTWRSGHARRTVPTDAQRSLRSVDRRALQRRLDTLRDGMLLTEDEAHLVDDLARQVDALDLLAELRPKLRAAIERIDSRANEIRQEIFRARLRHPVSDSLTDEVKTLSESILALCGQAYQAEEAARRAVATRPPKFRLRSPRKS
jgi:Bacterial transcriptional activator domain